MELAKVIIQHYKIGPNTLARQQQYDSTVCVLCVCTVCVCAADIANKNPKPLIGLCLCYPDRVMLIDLIEDPKIPISRADVRPTTRYTKEGWVSKTTMTALRERVNGLHTNRAPHSTVTKANNASLSLLLAVEASDTQDGGRLQQ